MTDPTTKTLPQDVKDRALAAIATLHAWNSAVHLARSLEAIIGYPGKYEYDLIAGPTPLWGQKNLAEHTLDTLVQACRAQGWSPDDFYTAVGQARPPLEKAGPHVFDWRIGDR